MGRPKAAPRPEFPRLATTSDVQRATDLRKFREALGAAIVDHFWGR